MIGGNEVTIAELLLM